MTAAPKGFALPEPPDRYDPETEAERNRILEAADEVNLKRGRDAEPNRLILTSPNGTRWVVSVDDTGTLTATSL